MPKLKIVLTENQWRRISEISSNFGLLTMGSVTLPALLDKIDPANVVLGLSVALTSWLASIFTARKYKL